MTEDYTVTPGRPAAVPTTPRVATTATAAATTAGSSALAITGFVLSLLSLCCCLGPLAGVPGAICGHVALSRIKQSNGALGGGGLALAAVIMGWISFGLILLWFTMARFSGPSIADARTEAQLALSQNNARQLAIACTMYAQEHDDALPGSFDDLLTAEMLVSSPLSSPFGPGDGSWDYELVLQGKISDYESPGTTVLIRDKYTSPDGRRAVVYLDGSAEVIEGNMIDVDVTMDAPLPQE